MNTLKEKIAVMMAFDAGRAIEARLVGRFEEWRPAPTPAWNWDTWDYRVAKTKHTARIPLSCCKGWKEFPPPADMVCVVVSWEE